MTVQVACEPFLQREDIECDCDALTDEEVEELIDQASDIIAILTGGKVAGECTTTVRPCAERKCGCSTRWGWPYDPGQSREECVPCKYDAITLPGPRPIINEIKIDGVTLDPSEYAIIDGIYLARVEGRWPRHQNILKPDTDDGTFSIEFTYGDLPYIARLAAQEIVCDMIKRDAKSGQTKALPPSARSATIAGVSIQLDQQVEEIRRRTIILPNLIRLLTVYAPDGPQPAVVFSPELEDGWVLHRVS